MGESYFNKTDDGVSIHFGTPGIMLPKIEVAIFSAMNSS